MRYMDKRIVKASFRECPLSDRALFKKSSCLLPISVGQNIHEGRKFEATLKLINTSFEKCTILVDDTVQRHTLKIIKPNNTEEVLYQKALYEGDQWLQRNAAAFAELKIPYKIERWDQWLSHPKFEGQLNEIKHLYDHQLLYRSQIDQNIKEYLERDVRKDVVNTEAMKCCLTYLQEECAVMSLWVEGGYNFEVYPNPRNKAMAATYQYLIEPFYPNLLRPVALRFKKYPNSDRILEKNHQDFAKLQGLI